MAYNMTVLRGTPSYSTAKFGNGLNDTSATAVIGTTAVINASTGTVEAWVRISSNSSQKVAVGNDGGGSSGIWIGASSSGAATFGTPSAGPYNSSITINDGAWHHLAVTVDGTNARLWIDGALGLTQAYTGTLNGAAGTTAIGGYGTTSSFDWTGYIDEVRFSNSVRYSSAFAAPTSTFITDSNTLALYHLDADGTDSASTPSSTSRFIRNIDLTSLVLSATGYQNANTQTASYTLALADVGKVVEMNISSANTVTIPTNASVGFSVGSIVDIYEAGAGLTTVTPASGVTVEAAYGMTLAGQYTSARLRQRAVNDWVMTLYSGSGTTGSGSTEASTSQTASYTFALTDAGTVVEGNSSSPLVFTVPPSSSVTWPAGTLIEIYQVGTGQVSLAAGSGVTLQNPSSLNLRAQYSTAGIRYRGSNVWAVSGDLA